MSHYTNLRLRSHKGLVSADLTSLGRINVVCGPNSSGKTTVLEAIATPTLAELGLTSSAQLGEQLASQSVDGAGWTKGQHYDRIYFRIVGEAVATQPIWFQSERDTLWNLVDQLWATNLANWAQPTHQLKHAYQSAFPTHPNTVFVPARRRLETSKPINSSDSVASDGTGLINFIFSARSQDESSPAYAALVTMTSAFRAITGDYGFDVHLQPGNQLELRFRSPRTGWLKAEDCGLGLHDLLIILYHATASDSEVVLMEEPESHLHPEMQRRLMSFLRNETDKQFFISTHSSVFLDTHFADHVFLCLFDGAVHIDSATTRAAILSELGYSIADNLVSDVIILCEGPSDKAILDEFLQKRRLLGKANIKIWPLGGDIMDQLDLTVFKQSYKVIALLDRDPGSSTVRRRFQQKCAELGIECRRLKRYALENYLSVAAIRSVMGAQFPSDVVTLDHTKSVARQLGFDIKRNGGRIARAMALSDLTSTDLDEFLNRLEELVSVQVSAASTRHSAPQ